MVITIETTVNAPVEKTWESWTKPEHIVRWNHASDDWHTTKAESDLVPGGKFSSRMEAKDGSMGFDFWGIFDVVEQFKQIDSTLGDGRKLSVVFRENGGKTHVVESFETEDENSADMQRQGWQAILNNFKQYTETLK